MCGGEIEKREERREKRVCAWERWWEDKAKMGKSDGEGGSTGGRRERGWRRKREEGGRERKEAKGGGRRWKGTGGDKRGREGTEAPPHTLQWYCVAVHGLFKLEILHTRSFMHEPMHVHNVHNVQ